MLADKEDAVDFLHGLRYRNETENGAMQYASMAGGMEIFIDGAGFDEQAHINSVLFQSLQVSDELLGGPALDSKIPTPYFILNCPLFQFQLTTRSSRPRQSAD